MSTKKQSSPKSCHVSNTFGLPCEAAHALCVTQEADLAQISGLLEKFDAVHVIGSASNLILPPVLEGLTLLMSNRGIRLVGHCDRYRYIDVAAGEIWHDWVTHAMSQGWYGLENLALIPGTVGAAPVQNIGAYGVEVASRVHSVRVWDPIKAEFLTLRREQCQFGYRDSLFKHPQGQHLLIVSVRFALAMDWQPVLDYPDLSRLVAEAGGQLASVTPQVVFDTVVGIRRNKLPDPTEIPNVGSFFKNPVVSSNTFQALRERYSDLVAYQQENGKYKLAAGWLIDRCGWKGRAMGPIRVHERQALVLTNTGGATAADVLRAAGAIEQDVYSKFGVRLEIEPACWAQV